ncbi:MAG: sterol desaturase family protein [Planctomycetota bacterium]|jgi:sterol desaturase/sphingolipid hydroxylase (fatty acid hydroxylase superfamily)
MLILIGVFLVGLVVFHFLERLAPIHAQASSGPRRSGYLADITASIVNGPVTSSLAKIGAIYLVLWMPQLDTPGMSTWAWGWQFAVFLLVNDFARYWLHRLYHYSDFLWRFHRVHHTATEMDALTAFRVHLGETIIKYGVIVLPFYLLHVDRSVIIIYGSIDVLKGFWHHANLRTSIGWLNYVLNSAELHWWHHSTKPKEMNSNLGSIFSVWDLLFGTFYYKRGQWPEKIGVDGMEHFPDTYHGLLASAKLTDDEAVARYAAEANRQSTPAASGPVSTGPAATGQETGHAEEIEELPAGSGTAPAVDQSIRTHPA